MASLPNLILTMLKEVLFFWNKGAEAIANPQEVEIIRICANLREKWVETNSADKNLGM